MNRPKKVDLINLLVRVRRVNNKPVQNQSEVDALHLAIDRALIACGVREPSEEASNPERLAHKKFVSSLFTSR